MAMIAVAGAVGVLIMNVVMSIKEDEKKRQRRISDFEFDDWGDSV